MNAWLKHSPFLAVGIYISGASRACRDQPNLTPTWVSTQLRNGWRLLPITLGPQAPCNPRFPRYGNGPGDQHQPGQATARYAKARTQGIAEAAEAVAAAQALGIVAGQHALVRPRGLRRTNNRAAASPRWRSSAPGPASSTRSHYVSGVYSSAGSGIWVLDHARVDDPDGVPPARPDLDRPLGRRGEHLHVVHPRRRLAPGRPDEAVRRRPQRDLGRGHDQHRPRLPRPRHGPRPRPERHCGGVDVDLADYPRGRGPAPTRRWSRRCSACSREQKAYAGKVNGTLQQATLAADPGLAEGPRPPAARAVLAGAAWMSLLAAGPQPVLKFGSTGPAVRRRPAGPERRDARDRPRRHRRLRPAGPTRALRAWQIATKRNGVRASSNPGTWAALAAGTPPR